MLRANITSNISAEALASALPKRLHAAAKIIGEAATDRVTEEVKSRIPAIGGWYSIYRDAIDYEESGDLRWSVSGHLVIDFSKVPAEDSLVQFQGRYAFGAILKPFNPWPIDLIPVLIEGYNDTVIARKAGDGAVETERDRILPHLPAIKQDLIDAGGHIGEDPEILRINGDTYADIAFLAQRLELGYEGFPHIPHWSIAIAKSQTDMGNWISEGDLTSRVNKAITGGAE